MTSQITTNDIFYTCLEEDLIAWQAMEKGYLDTDGVTTPRFLEQVRNQNYQLDLTSIEKIKSNVKAEFTQDGRNRNLPLKITTSLESPILAMHQLDTCLKVKKIGGSLFNELQTLFATIFKEWGGEITELFQKKLKDEPNDYDFHLETDCCEKVINKGLVKSLAEKFDWQYYGKEKLTHELAKSKKFSEKNHQPYLAHIFEAHPFFLLPFQENLQEIIIKAFCFDTAADIAQFYVRRLGKYDLVFPKKFRYTFTPINSFFVDITDLILSNSNQAFLDCQIGKEMRPQALWDANLFNMTQVESLPANPFDFTRIICHLTKKGRCYQKGGIQKAFLALSKEVDFAENLARQLFNRAERHHRWPYQALIALTFNASALLPLEFEGEIPKIWQWVLKFIGKGVHAAVKEPEDPLLGLICELLKKPELSFKDIYAQIQVSSTIVQQSSFFKKGKYICQPTQTENALFTQIEVVGSQLCTLFFPYKLVDAITHLGKLAELQPAILKAIRPIHDLLIKENPLDAGIEKSPLFKFRHDARRQFSKVTSSAFHLLEKKQEDAWEMGYLMLLSQLAMANDPLLLKELIKKLLSKNEPVPYLQHFLKCSGINCKETLFSKHTPVDQVRDLLSIDHEVFRELASEYLNEQEDTLIALYHENDAKTETILFDAFLNTLSRIKTLSDDRRNSFSKIALIAIQSKNRKDHPGQSLCFGYEVYRLAIISNENVLFASILKELANLIPNASYRNEFDFLSDFVKSFDLQNKDLLISSIQHRLEIKEKEQEELLLLLRILVQSEGSFENRYLFFEAIDTIPLKHFSKATTLLEQFHRSQTPTRELFDFYLSSLPKRPYLLKFALSLIGEGFQDHFDQMGAHLLAHKSPIPQSIFENYLISLSSHNRWGNLITIFTASPKVPFAWSCHTASLLIEAIAKHTSLPKRKENRLRELLEEIPLDLPITPTSKLAFGPLFLRFYAQDMKEKEFKKAAHLTQIRIKLGGMPTGFEKQDFELLSQLASQSLFLEANGIMESLLQQTSNLNDWMDIILIYLKNGNIAGFERIFKACKVASKTDLETLFRQMLSCKSLNKVFELMLELLFKFDFGPSFWLAYIENAATCAPIQIVETILELLADRKVPLDQYDKPSCWKWVLERLEEDHSQKFLTPNSWWPQAWEDYLLKPLDVQYQLIWVLLSGISNVIDSEKTKSASDVIKILIGLNMLDFEHFLDNQTILNVSKLEWYLGRYNIAFGYIEQVLLRRNGQNEQDAFQLIDEYLRDLSAKKHDVTVCLNFIKNLQDGNININPFVVLEYLKKIYNKASGYSQLLCLKTALYDILANKDSSRQNRELLGWAMEQLLKPGKLYGWEFADWCLGRPSLCLNKSQIRQIQAIKSDSKISTRDFLAIKIQHKLFNHRAFRGVIQDKNLELEKGFNITIQFLKDAQDFTKLMAKVFITLLIISVLFVSRRLFIK